MAVTTIDNFSVIRLVHPLQRYVLKLRYAHTIAHNSTQCEAMSDTY